MVPGRGRHRAGYRSPGLCGWWWPPPTAYGSHDTLPYREDFPLQPRFPYDVSKGCADLIARSYAFTYDLPVSLERRLGRAAVGARHRRPAHEAAGQGLEPDVQGSGTPHGEIDRQYLDSTAIREELGWRPRLELDEGSNEPAPGTSAA